MLPESPNQSFAHPGEGALGRWEEDKAFELALVSNWAVPDRCEVPALDHLQPVAPTAPPTRNSDSRSLLPGTISGPGSADQKVRIVKMGVVVLEVILLADGPSPGT